MKPLTKKCIVCGKEYAKPYHTSVSDWKERKYCSLRCINVGRIPHNKYLVSKKCGNCKNRFQPRAKKNKYCSRRCARAKQIIPLKSLRRGAKKRSGENNSSKRPEVREKLRVMFSGSNSHFWKGGKTAESKLIRDSLQYRNWRAEVFKRDNFTCQMCGQRGGKIQADHIKRFADYPELRLKLSNGRTLCIPCHRQTDTYAGNLKTKII